MGDMHQSIHFLNKLYRDSHDVIDHKWMCPYLINDFPGSPHPFVYTVIRRQAVEWRGLRQWLVFLSGGAAGLMIICIITQLKMDVHCGAFFNFFFYNYYLSQSVFLFTRFQ